MQLWKKILIGMALGLIVGVAIRKIAIMIGDDGNATIIFIRETLDFLGQLFIRLIKMIVVPLVFFSIIAGVTSMKEPSEMGRIGVKAIGAYLLTTIFAITIGLSVATIIQPGVGAEELVKDSGYTMPEAKQTSFAQTILNIVPTNPAASMAEGNVLQILFFAILFGIAAVMLGKQAEPFIDLNNRLAEVMYKVTNIVMAYAPVGVFGLMASIAAAHGPDVILKLFKVAAALLIGVAIHIFLVYGSMLRYGVKVSPLRFLRKAVNALSVAFSTSSSSATLPVTIKTAVEKVGVSRNTASFVLPLGTTINMDGTALYQGVCALFVAQVWGVDLTIAQYTTIILTATLASIGTAGVPGASFVMLTLILESIGLPIETAAVILSIDRILDMFRTMTNVTGDMVIATWIDKSEGHFDEGKFKV